MDVLEPARTFDGRAVSVSPPEALVVIGAGGQGREAVSLIHDSELRSPGRWDLIGVVADDEPDLDRLAALGTRWLGFVEKLRGMEARVSVAVGQGRARQRLQRLSQQLGCEPATLIHPTAAIGWDVEFGQGCYVGPLTAVTTHVRLADGVQINSGCTLSHDVVVGKFATLAPGIHLAGGAIVEEGATLFTGVSVLPKVRIGRGAVVGAGAVVIRDVAPGTTVVGVPAKALTKHRRNQDC